MKQAGARCPNLAPRPPDTTHMLRTVPGLAGETRWACADLLTAHITIPLRISSGLPANLVRGGLVVHLGRFWDVSVGSCAVTSYVRRKWGSWHMLF